MLHPLNISFLSTSNFLSFQGSVTPKQWVSLCALGIMAYVISLEALLTNGKGHRAHKHPMNLQCQCLSHIHLLHFYGP